MIEVRNIISAFLLGFSVSMLLNCNSRTERVYTKNLRGINYGEIHLLGSILSISIEDYDKYPLDTIIRFAYCLKEKKEEDGIGITLIKIHKHYYYIDQIRPSDLFLSVHFKFDLNPAKHPPNQIISVEKFENGNFTPINHAITYECNND